VVLKGIDPLLGPDLLRTLAAMGHGDTIAVCDANFPAETVARATTTGTLIRLDGVPLARAVAAILDVLPLDTFEGAPVHVMRTAGGPADVPDVQREAIAAIRAAEGDAVAVDGLDRFAFYDAARSAFAVVATGDRRAYGNVLLRKGVILADAPG